MMATRPLRRMTLHFSQIFFTDALTFISCRVPNKCARARMSIEIMLTDRNQPMQPQTNYIFYINP